MQMHELCTMEDIPDQNAREFSIDHEGETVEFFIVRKDEKLYGYINSCPHTGINLNWQPDQFLDLYSQLIQCSTHGALFRISDGYCIQGPCQGRKLIPVPVVRDKSQIYVKLG